MSKARVLIDTDISIGVPERDVDDGLALVMAVNSPQLTIDAITLTYGNSTIENVEGAMLELNKHLHWQGLIASGAKSSSDLGKPTEATEHIISLLQQDKHTIVALGPLTNIASVLKLCPELSSQVEQVVVVAGRRPGHRFLTGNHPLSHPDLNFEKDPWATEVLLNTNIPLILAPFEISSKVWITEEFLMRLAGFDSPVSAFLHKACLPWLGMWRERFSTGFVPTVGFNPFDCLAIACLTDHDLISFEPCDASIEYGDYDSTDTHFQGTGNCTKPYLHVRPNLDGKCRYAFDIEREEFLKRLLGRLH